MNTKKTGTEEYGENPNIQEIKEKNNVLADNLAVKDSLEDRQEEMAFFQEDKSVLTDHLVDSPMYPLSWWTSHWRKTFGDQTGGHGIFPGFNPVDMVAFLVDKSVRKDSLEIKQVDMEAVQRPISLTFFVQRHS